MKYLAQWLSTNQVIFPSYLFKIYKQLNLSDQEFLVLLHIMNFHQTGNDYAPPSEVASMMDIDTEKCRQIIHQLVQKGVLNIVTAYDARQNYREYYEFTALYKKMATIFTKNAMTEEQQSTADNLYAIFEQQFNRMIKPMEAEVLSKWIDEDNYPPDLIKLALKEAVISSALSFRYIDKILANWHASGITSVQQASKQIDKFHHKKSNTDSKAASLANITPKKLSLYNWAKD